MTEKVNLVFRTNEYGKFRKLDGNRSITDGRVQKIKKSIETVGYISSPIIVNEKFEIIDGQGRVEALKQLDMPIDYIVVKGAGLNECIALNINLKSWTLNDYIDSYAFTGNVSYQYLKQLQVEYRKELDISVIVNAVTGSVDGGNNQLKSGRFFCDERMYNNARKILDTDLQILPSFQMVQGTKKYYFMAFNYCLIDKEIEQARLIKQIKKYGHTLLAAPTMKFALEDFERIYNHSRKTYVYIYNNYQRYNAARNPGYAERRMKK